MLREVSRPEMGAPTCALAANIRAAGLRCTGPRLAVLTLLVERPQPQSHAEVFAALKDKAFDRATVYRTLLDLVDARLARRADLGDHVWRFALASGTGATLHFLCSDCGTIQTLPQSAVVLKGSPRTPRSFRRREVAVQITGRCDGCA